MTIKLSTGLVVLTLIFAYFSFKSAKAIFNHRSQKIESLVSIEQCKSEIEKLQNEKKNYAKNPDRSIWKIDDDIHYQRSNISHNESIIEDNEKSYVLLLISSILLGVFALISLIGFLLIKKNQSIQI